MALTASVSGEATARPVYPPRSAVISWIFFDWAAQPYFTLATTFVFAPEHSEHDPGPITTGSGLAKAVAPAFSSYTILWLSIPGPSLRDVPE
jgi:MFS-type transporter involved in bile tolerance (Atg22 family)